MLFSICFITWFDCDLSNTENIHVMIMFQDLSRLGRDLQQVAIVDNSPASYIFHPDNAVSGNLIVTFLFTYLLVTIFYFSSWNVHILIFKVVICCL